MRRSLSLLFVLIALALGVRPPPAAACSILPVPPEQRARMVQDTIDRADLIVQGTVVGTRPVAVDGRYYQQLTLDVVTTWRSGSAARVTVVGAPLTFDTSIASTIGVLTGTASPPPCGSSPPAVGADLLVFARNEGKGRLRLSTAAPPNDVLAATLRAQLGTGAAPSPVSPPFVAFLPLLIGVVAAFAGVAVVGVRHRAAPRLRRG